MRPDAFGGHSLQRLLAGQLCPGAHHALPVPAEGAYEVFAGRECARALGKMSKDEVDCTADLQGLTDAQMETLCDWEVKFRQKYPVVGSVSLRASVLSQAAQPALLSHSAPQVVASKRLTLKELLQYDGSDAQLPMLLAIKGTVFDISAGPHALSSRCGQQQMLTCTWCCCRQGLLWPGRHLPLCGARVRAGLRPGVHRHQGLQRQPGGPAAHGAGQPARLGGPLLQQVPHCGVRCGLSRGSSTCSSCGNR